MFDEVGNDVHISHAPKYEEGDLCYVRANLWGFTKGEIVRVTTVDQYDNDYRVVDIMNPNRVTWFDEDHLDPVPADAVLPERTKRISFRSGYMSRAHYPQVVSQVFRKLWGGEGNTVAEFDTIVGTGLSGSLVVPSLARSLSRHFGRKISYLLVRKDNDGSHSVTQLEGEIGKRWLFVDDLVESGNTVNRCVRKIRRDVSDAELVGVFLYGTSGSGAGLGSARLYPAREVQYVSPHGKDEWMHEADPYSHSDVVREYEVYSDYLTGMDNYRDMLASVA